MTKIAQRLITLMLSGLMTVATFAQRTTDNVDRGLVAVKTSSGVFCSWRITADEYYDVTYNIYRNGTRLNSEPLAVSNYLDVQGTTSSQYSVEAVVRGSATYRSTAVTPWSSYYKEIAMDHGSLTSTYVPNDACCADVDGDGEMEILIKFDNSSDAANGYLPGGYNGEYAIIEVYKLDGTKLWWIDLGPNMGDFQNNENNIVAYDWDDDGRAEAVLRAGDGTVIHMADGSTRTIGDGSANYRPSTGLSDQWFLPYGNEFLLYLNGTTGQPYQVMDYPLKRYEDGETDLKAAWGDYSGHRSTKHFFGAPYLDGRKPSIFLARGIYTRHKMIALDVDPTKHTLTERWRWNCNTPGSAWYGQGYHNFGIADVDWDGRDEICFGSMVIDDNGHGLSTTGLGHGDAQHCSDFDPYTPGQEIFCCNEDEPNNNLRDATTSRIYYRSVSSSDDGRGLMGNFLNTVPGAVGISNNDANIVGAVAHAAIGAKSDYSFKQNFRIYWDGDLCEEFLDGVGSRNGNGRITKPNGNIVVTLEDSHTNNDTKNTPCFQGDILGDWREEVIMRTDDNNIRIYTTNIPTAHRVYSLWHDHQYRQAMVWQMCGYNQPPHPSFYLGELEGITTPPPPLTMSGRTEISNGSTISSTHNDLHVMMCATGNMTVNVLSGAQPYIFTDNAPSWVQGHDDNALIDTTVYTHTLTGSAFSGAMRLVKQGDGVLVLPNVVQTYTGPTDIWGGTLQFDGTMQTSRVWLNRHTRLTGNGTYQGGIEADYNAQIVPGGNGTCGTITADSLILNFGAMVLLDVTGTSTDAQTDRINASVLKIGTVDWQHGPAYAAPVMRFTGNSSDGKIPSGRHAIGSIGKLDGSLSDIIVEANGSQKATLSLENGTLYLTVEDFEPGNVTWTGRVSGTWEVDGDVNFVDDATSSARVFVPNDAVTFNDAASTTAITVAGNVQPASVTFDNSRLKYTLSGDGLVGNATLIKTGEGSLTLNSANSLGSVSISGGTVGVASLANEIGQTVGSLGSVSTPVTIGNGATLAIETSATAAQPFTVTAGGATFDVASGQTLRFSTGIGAANAADAVVNKSGEGTLALASDNAISRLVIANGAVEAAENSNVMQLPATVEFQGGKLWDAANMSSYSTNAANFVVGADNEGSLYLDPRCNYTGTLTGAGTLSVYAASVRNYLQGDWSAFTGKVIADSYRRGAAYTPSFDWCNDFGLPNATLEVASGTSFKNEDSEGKKQHNVEIGHIILNDGATICGPGTYTIGSLGRDFTLAGTVSSPIVKVGSGTWTVNPGDGLSQMGAVSVNGGRLLLNADDAPAESMMGDNAVTVASAEVSGIGTMTSLVAGSGATITPGHTESGLGGALRTTGDMTIEANTATNLCIYDADNNSTSRSYLYAGGKLTVNGSVNVSLDYGYLPANGDAIELWQCATFSGSPSVNLPALPTGQSWDTSNLRSASGIVRVVGSPQSITVAIGSSGYATLSSKYALNFASVEGLQAFKATVVDDQTHVTLTEVESAPGNTGLVLKGAEGNYVIPIVGSSSADMTGNDLIPTADGMHIASDEVTTYYGLKVLRSGEAGFARITDIQAPAGKAYLALPTSIQAAKLTTLYFEPTTTGIDAIDAANSPADGTSYDLGGQPASDNQRGIVIRNGKKIVVK